MGVNEPARSFTIPQKRSSRTQLPRQKKVESSEPPATTSLIVVFPAFVDATGRAKLARPSFKAWADAPGNDLLGEWVPERSQVQSEAEETDDETDEDSDDETVIVEAQVESSTGSTNQKSTNVSLQCTTTDSKTAPVDTAKTVSSAEDLTSSNQEDAVPEEPAGQSAKEEQVLGKRSIEQAEGGQATVPSKKRKKSEVNAISLEERIRLSFTPRPTIITPAMKRETNRNWKAEELEELKIQQLLRHKIVTNGRDDEGYLVPLTEDGKLAKDKYEAVIAARSAIDKFKFDQYADHDDETEDPLVWQANGINSDGTFNGFSMAIRRRSKVQMNNVGLRGALEICYYPDMTLAEVRAKFQMLDAPKKPLAEYAAPRPEATAVGGNQPIPTLDSVARASRSGGLSSRMASKQRMAAEAHGKGWRYWGEP